MNDTDRIAIARNVRRHREAIGASQAAVAQAMRRDGFGTWRQTTLAKVEASARALKLEEAIALAEIYETTIDALVKDGRGSSRRLMTDTQPRVYHCPFCLSEHAGPDFPVPCEDCPKDTP